VSIGAQRDLPVRGQMNDAERGLDFTRITDVVSNVDLVAGGFVLAHRRHRLTADLMGRFLGHSPCARHSTRRDQHPCKSETTVHSHQRHVTWSVPALP
jgi:hypothetical protein